MNVPKRYIVENKREEEQEAKLRKKKKLIKHGFPKIYEWVPLFKLHFGYSFAG